MQYPTHNLGSEPNAYIFCTGYDYPFTGDHMKKRIEAVIARLGIIARVEQRQYKKVVPRRVLFSTVEKNTTHYILVAVVSPETDRATRIALNGACIGFAYGINPQWD